MAKRLPAGTPLDLQLEFEGAGKFTIVDFRLPPGGPWANTTIELAREIDKEDPAPYEVAPLLPGQVAVLIVAANLTTPTGTGSVKVSGDLELAGQTGGADADSGTVSSEGYSELYLRFELEGA